MIEAEFCETLPFWCERCSHGPRLADSGGPIIIHRVTEAAARGVSTEGERGPSATEREREPETEQSTEVLAFLMK